MTTWLYRSATLATETALERHESARCRGLPPIMLDARSGSDPGRFTHLYNKSTRTLEGNGTLTYGHNELVKGGAR